MSKRKQNNDSVSESESECSDGRNYEDSSSSENESEKSSSSSVKKKKKEKESSKKTKVQQKKVEDKPIPIKKDKDKSKSRNHKNRPPKGFDEDISLDMSLNKLNKKRVKLSSNILIETKIVEVKEQGKENFSFPALVFVKKMSDGKLFEFNLPLNISVKLQDALGYINAK
jgi:hypothetical protein